MLNLTGNVVLVPKVVCAVVKNKKDVINFFSKIIDDFNSINKSEEKSTNLFQKNNVGIMLCQAAIMLSNTDVGINKESTKTTPEKTNNHHTFEGFPSMKSKCYEKQRPENLKNQQTEVGSFTEMREDNSNNQTEVETEEGEMAQEGTNDFAYKVGSSGPSKVFKPGK